MVRRRNHTRLRTFCSRTFASATLAMALMFNLAQVRADNSVTIGGPWILVAPDGTTVTDRTYRGQWLHVFIGYTSCPDTCPKTLHEVAVALQKLGPEAARVQPLFITVDPQHDTPDIMRDYTASFDSRIIGLSGEAEQIAAATREFGVYHVTHLRGHRAEGRLIDHSTYLYVIDPQGIFVRGFDADTPGDHIANVLSGLVRQ
jgi:protein SCO1/2